MTLLEVNQKLEEIAVDYASKIRELREAELRYNLRFYDLLLHSGMGTIVAKEAEANTVCHEEGLLEPVQTLRAEVKSLYYEKDCYIEIGKNLRTIQQES